MNAVTQVRQQIIDSQLMSAESVDEQIARWREQTGSSGEAAGEELLDWLVRQQALTAFHGAGLRAGLTGPFMLGPYHIHDQAAAGRLGTVYRAVHVQFHQPVSLKVFPSSLKENAEQLARMEREIRVSMELDHPNVVRTYHMGQVGDIFYLAFEDMRGETLHDRLQRDGALPYPTACAMIRDAARGLSHFHDKFLVHRDVRPGNLWITESGAVKVMETGAVGVAQTGLEETDSGTVTTSGTVLGTYDYMAPEQARDAHSADHRSDIYSLGCTLYQALSGRPPFVEPNPVRMVMQHQSATPTPLVELAPAIPAELSDFVGFMLAKTPEQRYQSMEDVARDLELYADPTACDVMEEAGEEYLAWARQSAAAVGQEVPEAASPEQNRFLRWLADGQTPDLF